MSKATQKKSEVFKKRADALISKIEDLINKMPDKGLKSEDSQKVCLQQAIDDFSYTVNGVEPSDFEKEKD